MTKKPSYRFAGYTESWEEKRLGEISSRVKGNDGRMDLPTLTISAGQGWLDQRERFSGNIAGKEQKNYTLLRIGELSYNHGNSKLAKYGVVFQLNNYTEALVPKVYHSFKMIDGRSGTFFEFLFATKIPDRELSKLVSSGARMDGLLNITYDDFMSIKLTFPKNNEEQTAIGSFFQVIDQFISLQQRKLEVLKEQKKTYLKLLFPAKGQTKPALRFAGFEDEWKEVKLGEIGEIQTGNTPPTNEEDNYEKNGFPWVTPTDINSLVLHTTSKQLSEVGKSKARIAKSGSILVTCIASIGKNTLVRTDSAFNQQINSLTPSEKYSSYFLLTQSEIWSRYMLSVAGAGTMQIINKSDFSNIKAMVPSLPEQETIGSFFQDLDKSIAKQEEKVNKLKESKQTLLRKMFI